MAKIQSEIVLQDNFSPVLQNIAGFINLAMGSMLDLQETVSRPFEPAALQGMQEYVSKTNLEMRRLVDNLENLAPPELTAPFVPWQWQSDSWPVFMDSGLARFEQELAAVNSHMNALYNTQAQVAAAAANIDWLPDNALADLGNMQNRLQGIWQQVYQIGSNPLNFGSDLANQELERMRAQLALAVQEQERLNAAVDNMDLQAANAAYLQLSQTVSGLERYIRDNTDEQGSFNDAIHQGMQNAFGLGSALSGMVKAYLGLAGVRKAINWGQNAMAAFDVQMNAQMQLGTVVSNMGMADYYDEIVAQAAAIQGHGIYGDEIMIAGAAELATYFTDGDAVLSIMDTLTDYAAGMSGGAELSAQQMTDYATGLGKVMTGSYEAMTKKGFEFSDAQKAIIEGTASHAMIAEQLGVEYLEMSADMQAAAAINQVIAESWGGMYEAMSATPHGQIIQLTNAWGDLQEQIGQGLYPYVMLFVNVFRDNWTTIQGVMQGIASGFNTVLGVLSWVTEAGLGFADMVMNNWIWISPLIYGAAAALGVYGAALLANNTLQGVNNGLQAIAELRSQAAWAALNMQTGATFGATVAQYGFNAALYACPITWVVGGIIAGAAALTAFCAWLAHTSDAAQTTFGALAGCINVVWQLIVNLVQTAVNAGLAIWNAFWTCIGNISIAFDNAFAGIKKGFYTVVSKILGGIAKIAEALNSLPFVEFDYSGLTSRADEYANKAAQAAAIQQTEYLDVGAAFSKGWHTYDVFQNGWAAEAFAQGANWGDNLNLFGVQELDMSAYDLLNNSVWDNMDNSLQEIAANTGGMVHKLNMTDEDLKYMRDIAERETVNRFTTAEIVVNMGGITNQINKMDDLDGIITYLLDGVNEAVEIGAEGVHI